MEMKFIFHYHFYVVPVFLDRKTKKTCYPLYEALYSKENSLQLALHLQQCMDLISPFEYVSGNQMRRALFIAALHCIQKAWTRKMYLLPVCNKIYMHTTHTHTNRERKVANFPYLMHFTIFAIMFSFYLLHRSFVRSFVSGILARHDGSAKM